ncbi:hypothetical protein GLE_2155 [Lysobacter enzymogenes]|uniref:Uncharacterized protein n=1 Tax=Lysobacter enzymogenes TaxID=69 RepID=A0A0S2DG15_LYSEN|nr:hypothetical protein GLE_2155 [Lysobacter enzymogenes]
MGDGWIVGAAPSRASIRGGADGFRANAGPTRTGECGPVASRGWRAVRRWAPLAGGHPRKRRGRGGQDRPGPWTGAAPMLSQQGLGRLWRRRGKGFGRKAGVDAGEKCCAGATAAEGEWAAQAGFLGRFARQ